MRHILILIIVLVFSLAGQVSAAERVALAISVSSYEHVPDLPNPENDATDVGAEFERLGFEVTYLRNPDHGQLLDALRRFKDKAAGADAAVIYYAGHGIEVDDQNFLIPADARLARDTDIEYEAVALDHAVRAVGGAQNLGAVFLDACRDNPFTSDMQRSSSTRSIGRGLARMEPRGNTIVAYAARDGTVAQDGQGRNSPYAAALVHELRADGQEIGIFLRRVHDRVLTLTGGQQEPVVYGALSSKPFYFSSSATPAAAHPFDGKWQAVVHDVTGCKNNSERRFPFTLRESEIVGPDQKVRKSGHVTPAGALTISISDGEGRHLASQEIQLSGDTGDGVFIGKKPNCRGIVRVQRLE